MKAPKVIFNKYILLALFINYTISIYGVDFIADSDTIIHLNQVVISANKIHVNKNNVPLTISIIEREQIENSNESSLLPILSERVPGLFVTEKGITGFGVSAGSAGTVNIRGVGQGNKVLTLFDGQPQWAGLFGHSLPDTYVASDIERVEVIRGPGSLLYGSNAMGGVVNIITRQHQKPGRVTQARTMYGSYNTQKYMINNGYNIKKFSSFISINHDYTKGHRENSKFRITNGFVNLGYHLNDKLKLSGSTSFAKFITQNPGTISKPILDNTMDIARGSASIALENNFLKLNGALRFFHNWGNHLINDGYFEGSQPRSYIFHSKDHNYGILLYETFRIFKGNLFTIGLDYKNWGGHAWNANKNGTKEEIINKAINETAGYLIIQQDLFNKISLNGGIRYEYNQVFGSEWVPQAGLAIRPFEGNIVKLSVSKGFRSPNIREMYMYPPQNPGLNPEKMYNYELSIAQTSQDRKFNVELTTFFIKGSNMIQIIPVDGKPLNINTGTFINKGFEIDGKYMIAKNIEFITNYSYLITDKPLLAAPRHKFFAGIGYRPGKLSIDLNMQSVFKLYINTIQEKLEDYTLLNARISYSFGTKDKGANIFLKGDNLTATNYSINEGFPMPKMIIMGGVHVTF